MEAQQNDQPTLSYEGQNESTRGVPLVAKLVFPMNTLILLLALVSAIMRPDFNVILALITVFVLRAAQKEHFQYLCYFLGFSVIADIVWLAVNGSDDSGFYQKEVHSFFLFCGSLVVVLKAIFCY